MSLARQFFREFRPLFRMLEEPLGRSTAVTPSFYPRHNSNSNPFTLLSDPFFTTNVNVPEVDLSEEGNNYVVEASVPGVKRENLELRIGDSGQSLTIRGRTVVTNVKENGAESSDAQTTQSGGTSESPVANAAQTAESESEYISHSICTHETIRLTIFFPKDTSVTKLPESDSRALSTERTFTSTSSFSRTIWFPQRVDEKGVAAKLADGVLTVRVPKAEEVGSFKVNIE